MRRGMLASWSPAPLGRKGRRLAGATGNRQGLGMRFLRSVAAAAPLAALAACATTATAPSPQASRAAPPAPALAAVPLDEASPYGLFLAGRGAMNQGRSVDASGY